MLGGNLGSLLYGVVSMMLVLAQKHRLLVLVRTVLWHLFFFISFFFITNIRHTPCFTKIKTFYHKHNEMIL